MRPHTDHTDLRDVFQIAYVTTDLDQALAVLGERVGMTRFGRMGEIALDTPSGGTLSAEVALAWAGETQIEVIEPCGGDDALYRDPLPTDGSFAMRFHHLGALVSSLDELARRRENLQRSGMRIALSGEHAGSSAFFYADARTTLGHYLEYLYFTPERLAYHRAAPTN